MKKFKILKKQPEVKLPEIREISDMKEAIQLQKEGWIVTDIKSSPKRWMLKK